MSSSNIGPSRGAQIEALRNELHAMTSAQLELLWYTTQPSSDNALAERAIRQLPSEQSLTGKCLTLLQSLRSDEVGSLVREESEERNVQDSLLLRSQIHQLSDEQFDMLSQHWPELPEGQVELSEEMRSILNRCTAADVEGLIHDEALLRLEEALDRYIAAKPEEVTRRDVKDKILQCSTIHKSFLDLAGLHVTELPTLNGCGIGQLLKKVDSLYLSKNHLTNLPDWIGAMTRLRKLECLENELEVFPACLFSLQDLICLDLSDNNLTEVPEQIGQLRLGTLCLAKNDISSLPDLNAMRGLTTLDLRGTAISAISDDWYGLPYLLRIDVRDTNLARTLPLCGDVAAGWSATKGIIGRKNILAGMAGDQLEQIRRAVDKISHTVVSYLTARPVELHRYTVEQQINNCLNHRSTSLIFDSLQISALPDFNDCDVGIIFDCVESLKVDRIPNLDAMPDWFGELKYLKRLQFSNSGLTGVPEWIGNLSALQELDMHNTNVEALPNLSTLEKLETLNFSDTRVSALPAWITNHPSLKKVVPSAQLLQQPPEGWQLPYAHADHWVRTQALPQDAALQEGQPLLRVTRNMLNDDPLRVLQGFVALIDRLPADEPVEVKIEGEEGIDAGGLRREVIEILVGELFSTERPHISFTNEQGLVIPDCHTEEDALRYAQLGQLMAYAVSDSYFSEIYPDGGIKPIAFPNHFAPTVFPALIRFMRGASPAEVALAARSPKALEAWERARAGAQRDGDEAWLEGLTDALSEMTPDERNALPGESELEKAVLHLYGSTAHALSALLSGFEPVLVRRAPGALAEIRHLESGEDLQHYICGYVTPEVVIASMVSADTNQADWIKAWIETASPEKLEKLMSFITGSSTLAPNQHWKLSIDARKDVALWPESHTCFSELVIPPYPDAETLNGMLNTITELDPKGFGFFSS